MAKLPHDIKGSATTQTEVGTLANTTINTWATTKVNAMANAKVATMAGGRDVISAICALYALYMRSYMRSYVRSSFLLYAVLFSCFIRINKVLLSQKAGIGPHIEEN